jgi:hypothetical protein
MTVMRCDDFFESLDRWLDGDHSPEASRHLSECANCRALVEDLGAITSAAPSLASLDLAPPEHLWTSLRSALEKEGLIGTEQPAHVTPARGRRWLDEILAAIPRPALAGAYLAAILAVSLALVGPLRQHFGENRLAATGVSPAVESPLNAQLDSDEQDAIASLGDSSPVVTASLQNSLAIVDNHIALCKKSLSEDPTSEAERDYLYEAYQQKADLLAEISERGAMGR